MRWFVGLCLLAIILAMILWTLATGLDRGVVAAIERGGEQRLGVPVEVATADTGLLAEALEITGLRIANPEGFEQPWFLTMDRGRIAVRTRSLFGDQRARVPEIVLEDIDLLLARSDDGRINYREIMEHLDRSASRETEESAAGKRFQIDRLLIRDIQVEFSGLPVVGEQEMQIQQIELTELRDDLSSGDIAAVVVQEILEAVARQGGPLKQHLQETLQETLQDTLQEQFGSMRDLIPGREG